MIINKFFNKILLLFCKCMSIANNDIDNRHCFKSTRHLHDCIDYVHYNYYFYSEYADKW